MAKSDDDDPGYEVVPPKPPKPPVAKALPAKPVSPAKPAVAKPALPAPTSKAIPKKPTVVDDDYEVVDTPPKKKPVVQAVDDDYEVVETPPKKKKPSVRAVVDDDEDDDTPKKKKSRRDEPDDEDDDQPKKKKKKGSVKKGDEEPGFLQDNMAGFIVLVLGFVMLVVGAWGVANHKENQWNPFITIVVLVVGEFIAIPVIIAALFVIGGLFGIEYGSFSSGVLNLAAMGFFVNGVTWVCEWMRIPDFVYGLVVFIVSVGLFIALLRLDVWETMITMVGLNLLSWIMNFIFLILLVFLLAKAGSMGGGGGSGGGGGGGGGFNQVDEEDDWDPEDGPRPNKQKQPKANTKKGQNKRPPVTDPDDGD